MKQAQRVKAMQHVAKELAHQECSKNEKLYLVKNLAERLVIEKNMFSDTLEELKKVLSEF